MNRGAARHGFSWQFLDRLVHHSVSFNIGRPSPPKREHPGLDDRSAGDNTDDRRPRRWQQRR